MTITSSVAISVMLIGCILSQLVLGVMSNRCAIWVLTLAWLSVTSMLAWVSRLWYLPVGYLFPNRGMIVAQPLSLCKRYLSLTLWVSIGTLRLSP